MRVTRKVLDQLCANVNEARGALVGRPPGEWQVGRRFGRYYVVSDAGSGNVRRLREGLTASECEAFLQGALEVARS